MTVASLSLVDAVRVCAWPRGGGRGLAASAAGRSSTRCPTAASRCAGGRLLRAHRVPPAGSRHAASARGERCGGAPAAGANGGGRVGPHVQLPTGMPRVDAPARCRVRGSPLVLCSLCRRRHMHTLRGAAPPPHAAHSGGASPVPAPPATHPQCRPVPRRPARHIGLPAGSPCLAGGGAHAGAAAAAYHVDVLRHPPTARPASAAEHGGDWCGASVAAAPCGGGAVRAVPRRTGRRPSQRVPAPAPASGGCVGALSGGGSSWGCGRRLGGRTAAAAAVAVLPNGGGHGAGTHH